MDLRSSSKNRPDESNTMKDRQGKKRQKESNESDQQDFHIHPFEALTAATLSEVKITVCSADKARSSTSSSSKSKTKTPDPASKRSTSSTQLRFPGIAKHIKKMASQARPQSRKVAPRTPSPPPPRPVEKDNEAEAILNNLNLSLSSSPDPSTSTEDLPDLYLLNYKSHSRMIEMMLHRSLLNPEFSDILLGCENEVYHCHKLVLAAASQQLARLIENTTVFTPTSQQVIMLVGVRPVVLKNILEFIYKGTVHVLQENMADFIKIGNELKIEGIFIANVSPSASSTNMVVDEGAKEDSGTGKEVGWFEKDKDASYPPSVMQYLTTEIDESLPVSTLASNGSSTLTATSDLSFNDDGMNLTA